MPIPVSYTHLDVYKRQHVWFPFETKNVKKVEIEVTRIFQNNVLQFLQYNSFEETYNLHPVGKSIFTDTIDLSKIAPLPQNYKWQKYTLDLGKMVKVEKGAIYNVKISFDENCLIDYPCNLSLIHIFKAFLIGFI